MDSYGQLRAHRPMLSDRVRCEAYRRALAKWVKAGDVVLDVGAGTGILSLFAAQSGARKVYAVERTSIVNLARQLIEANGLAEQVQVIHGDVETVELPEQVDIIVSEWMGGYGVDEGLLPAVLHARDRWLKTEGKMLPERVTAWMAPVSDCELERDLRFWRSRPYDVDLSLIAEMTAREVRYGQHHVTEDTLLAEPQPMWTTDVYTCSIDEARSPFKASLSFPVTREGNFNALATWFHAEFGHGVALTNSPNAPRTHWGRCIFPLSEAMRVWRGTEVSVEFTCEPEVNAFAFSAERRMPWRTLRDDAVVQGCPEYPILRIPDPDHTMVCSANGYEFTIPADPSIIELIERLNAGESLLVGNIIEEYTGVTLYDGVKFVVTAEGIRTVLSKLYSLRAIRTVPDKTISVSASA